MLGLLTALSISLTGSPCWDIYDAAMLARAASPQPPYIVYLERTSLLQDGFQLVRANAVIQYRQDGLARVADDRFDGYTYLTDHVDPGPPELGPYGSARATWLPSPGGLVAPEISDVRTHEAKACTNLGVESYRGHTTYHLEFTPYSLGRPSLKDMWIDTSTKQIWKVVVSGYLRFTDLDNTHDPLVDFAVELSQEGPYVMVDHVTWSYRQPVYSQFSNLFGEYTMWDFQYPPRLSNDVFAAAWKAPTAGEAFARWWATEDSNLGPPPYQGDALTN